MRAVALLSISVCLTIAGCGGDDDVTENGAADAPASSPASQAPASEQDIEEFAQLWRQPSPARTAKG